MHPQLEDYHQLLKKYHHTLDLMSEQGLAHISQKFSHSQQYSAFIAQQYGTTPIHIVDVGSGAGLPAIPIAIALPHVHIHLVERRRKRASFLQIVVSQLALKNVSVHSCDVQKLDLAQPVEVVTALAVGNFGYLHRMCQHLLTEHAWLVSRKGTDWREDVATLRVPYQQLHEENLVVEADDEGLGSKLIAVQL